MGGILAADVEGRIGLGVAQPLGGAQRFTKTDVVLLHARQDIVRRAVEDAVDALDRVAGQRLAQRLDDRDAARCRRLEIETDALFLRRFRQRNPVLGE